MKCKRISHFTVEKLKPCKYLRTDTRKPDVPITTTSPYKLYQPKVKRITLLSYSDFMQRIGQSYDSIPIVQILKEVVNKNENIVGQGIEGIIYKIDKVPEYLIKVPHTIKEIPADFKLESVIDYFPKNNFGQAVASSAEGISVIKRINGINHDILMEKIHNQNGIYYKEDAEYFLDNIKKISKFNDSAFIDFARNVKATNGNIRYLVDPNPYNLIVDFKNQKFGIIDLYDRAFWPLLEDCESDVSTMINMILSPINHCTVYNILEKAKQDELINASRIIIKKCLFAADKVKLKLASVSQDEVYDIVLDYLKFNKNSYANVPIKTWYRQMCDLYPDLLPIKNSFPKDISHKSYIEKLTKLAESAGGLNKNYLTYLYTKGKINRAELASLRK